MNPPSNPRPSDLGGLDPAGLLRGVLGDASASWPAEGPVAWTPPDGAEVADWFPGFTEIRLLGRGGMGAVYAARQTSLDRNVALKLLPAEFSRDPAATERFRREARALAKLNHPNIVAIHDFGETPGGTFFIIMEHVEGADLHRLIRDGDLPLTTALDVVRQVCDALEFAHSQGVVHRDIKPANILVDAQGRVKVSDFGLAILLTDPSSELSLSMTHGVVGTPEYVAPEQRRGAGPVDHRADLYSLGVMLYEMLTGTLPCGAFEPPSRRSEVNGKMDRVVIRAMQQEPDRRYQHASEVRNDVRKACPRSGYPGWARAAVVLAGMFAVAGAVRGWQQFHLPSTSTSSAEIHTNGLGMKFVPAGTPGVLFSTLETRRGEFGTFVAETGHHSAGRINFVSKGAWKYTEGTWESPPGMDSQSDTHPVTCVSEVDALLFCEWLTARERASGRISGGDRYRLPSAAEWHAAAGLSADPLTLNSADAVVPLHLAAIALAPRNEVPGELADLSASVAEWTSSPGRRFESRNVCGTSWVEIPPPAGTITVRAYDRNLRGVGLGFRIVLDRDSGKVNP